MNEIRIKLPEEDAEEIYRMLFNTLLTHIDIEMYDKDGVLLKGYSGSKPSMIFKGGKNL